MKKLRLLEDEKYQSHADVWELWELFFCSFNIGYEKFLRNMVVIESYLIETFSAKYLHSDITYFCCEKSFFFQFNLLFLCWLGLQGTGISSSTVLLHVLHNNLVVLFN